MLSFNEKLKEITIWEILLISILSYILIFVLPIPEDLVFVPVIIYILIRTRHHFKSMKDDFTHPFSKIPFSTVLLIFLANLILAIGIGYLTDYLLAFYPWLEYLPSTGENLVPAMTVAYILSFVGTVIIAPVSEELIFRGVVLSRFNRRLPIVLSVVISSLLFGLLHGFSGLISAFIFGVCMCFIYLKTDNIFTSMTVHMLNNLTVMIMMFIPNIDEFLAGDVPTWIIIILSIISFVWIVNFLRKAWGEIGE